MACRRAIPVRYRGITVGEIVEIDLDKTLEAVVVRIQLTEAAAEVAREGARFWIERPNISIGKVRGLDTLMGGRFVGVLPGPIDAPACRQFYGLEVASAPVRNIADGLEITLESKRPLRLAGRVADQLPGRDGRANPVGRADQRRRHGRGPRVY